MDSSSPPTTSCSSSISNFIPTLMSLFHQVRCTIKVRDDSHKSPNKQGEQYHYTKLSPPSPLPSLKVYASGKTLWLEWNKSSGGLSITSGEIKFQFKGGDANFIFGSGLFPPSPVGKIGTTLPIARTEYTGVITLNFEVATSNLAQSSVEFAPSVVPPLLSRTSANVCFRFPRTNNTLWMNEDLLRNESPYFEQLLSSSFLENTLSSASDSPASPQLSQSNGAQSLAETSDSALRSTDDCDTDTTDYLPYIYEDSDEELEELSPKGRNEEGTRNQNAPFKLISITDTTYTTYLSVLCWICTRYIAFAPLSSSFTYSAEEDAMDLGNDRLKSLESTFLSQRHTLPVPASPKSVHRLCHLLMIPDLARIALENFTAQLTPQNVAFELYSDVASNYHEIRDAALDFAVENWNDVVESKAWKDVERRAAEGESGVVDGLTGMLLSKALGEA